ncbi:Oidioi.mRNA.OKI2018_I69.chr1.g6.t1.cds [Oikopleura dioica]|uniref:Oidioi.mRNA.OKI2018_I69.chr1.g6.t1.cds n=1 Tax=Oikopleura dioica TaxID=34765 RepID=A0ABN7SIG9_OIKDI|nr:Oidioi.mRNA.OKI2018_I69.chr1.g6.t1.cds [Oikopleura dioica]
MQKEKSNKKLFIGILVFTLISLWNILGHIKDVMSDEVEQKSLLVKVQFEDSYNKTLESEPENCTRDETDIFLDLALLERNYPELKGKRRKIEGKYYPFLNEMLRFNKNMKPSVIQQPDECQFQDSSLPSLIFGIKSMPKAIQARETLRRTWLRKEIWKTLGFEIKVVFITGKDKGWGPQQI